MFLERLPSADLSGPLLTCAEKDDRGRCLKFLPTCDGDDCLTESPPHPTVTGRKKKRSAPTGKKAPWRMTESEWRDAVDSTHPETVQTLPTRGSGAEAARKIAEHERLNYDAYVFDRNRGFGVVRHKLVIAKAFTEGKKIPKAVLLEYPDIAEFATSEGYKRGRQGILDVIERHKKNREEAKAYKESKGFDIVYKMDFDSALEKVKSIRNRGQNYYVRKKSPQRTYVDSKTPLRGQSYAKVLPSGGVLWYNAAHEEFQKRPESLHLEGDLLTCARWIVVGKGADQLIRCGSYKQTCRPGDAECAPALVSAQEPARAPKPERTLSEYWFFIWWGRNKAEQVTNTELNANPDFYYTAETRKKGRLYKVPGFDKVGAKKQLSVQLQRAREYKKQWRGRNPHEPAFYKWTTDKGYRIIPYTLEQSEEAQRQMAAREMR